MMDGGEQVDSVALPLPLQAMLVPYHRGTLQAGAEEEGAPQRSVRGRRGPRCARRPRGRRGQAARFLTDGRPTNHAGTAVPEALVAAQARRFARAGDTADGTAAPDVAKPPSVAAGGGPGIACRGCREPPHPALPPVDSLSFDSDFTPFLQPKVDESLKRQALRKLFADPRFNVMDGLDVYIDDYSKFEPITPELVAQLNHAKFLFDPPKTRVNEHGHVEDVPDEQVAEADRRIGRAKRPLRKPRRKRSLTKQRILRSRSRLCRR